MRLSGIPYTGSVAAVGLAGLFAIGCSLRAAAVEMQAPPVPRPAGYEGAGPAAAEIREPSASPPPGVVHVVEPGQTLWRIARVYGIGLDELQRVNGIADASRIAEGTSLSVPGAVVPREVPPFPASLPEPPDPRGADPPGTVAATVEPGTWIWPVRGGQIVGRFGDPRRSRRHAGLDIRGQTGQPILAARAGRVEYSGDTLRGYGRTVVIDHGDGTSTLYAHNSDLLVREGELVDAAQEIARLGSSGNATVAHCHFELHENGRPVNPLPLLTTRGEEDR
jgi:lipoprotein NlpD